jgi:hypothetical protein
VSPDGFTVDDDRRITRNLGDTCQPTWPDNPDLPDERERVGSEWIFKVT